MNDTEYIPPNTITINTNKRALPTGADYDHNTKLRKVCDVAIPEWLCVEQVRWAIKHILSKETVNDVAIVAAHHLRDGIGMLVYKCTLSIVMNAVKR
eukprot:10137-Heterococcus_DN1.PRE.5